MTGLVYKEIRHNWRSLLMVLILPAVMAYPLCVFVISSIEQVPGQSFSFIEHLRAGNGSLGAFTFLIAAFAEAGFFQGMVFREDDRKSFAMWIASTPEGVRGYIRIKYELIFVMMMLTLFSLQLGGLITEMICGAYEARWPVMDSVMIMLSYLQIILRAIELPFTVRFGVKNGSIIKSIFLVILAILVLIVYLLYGEEIADVIASGDTERLGTAAQTVIAVLPVIALAMYYLSYRLSCKLYLKGAEQYDK